MKIFQKTFIFLFFLFPIFSYAENSVDLIIEPNTYIPPFYQGRPSFISEASAKVIAIPHIEIDGQKVSNGNLFFKWKVSGLFPEDNAFGKDTVIVRSRIPVSDIKIGIEMLDANMKPIVSSEAKIKINQPSIFFYENSSLYGLLFNKAISSIDIGDREEIKIAALPFSFSDWNKLTYDWSINGEKISTLSSNEVILKRTADNAKGITQVSLTIKNPQKITQYTGINRVSINFGK